jgi:hypothetical protein
MTNHIDAELRISERYRVLKGAQVIFRGGSAVIDCTLRDHSETGAKLIVASPFGIPDQFNLVRSGARNRPCRVVWRNATQIGVEFLDNLSLD